MQPCQSKKTFVIAAQTHTTDRGAARRWRRRRKNANNRERKGRKAAATQRSQRYLQIRMQQSRVGQEGGGDAKVAEVAAKSCQQRSRDIEAKTKGGGDTKVADVAAKPHATTQRGGESGGDAKGRRSSHKSACNKAKKGEKAAATHRSQKLLQIRTQQSRVGQEDGGDTKVAEIAARTRTTKRAKARRRRRHKGHRLRSHSCAFFIPGTLVALLRSSR